ncbi:hypothetical protein F4861DRAFT_520534 [Xylaria intraflava]|nr:hypothetical protein F4861DRAFT_520534 [Xylaria intraflava]
MVAAAQYGEVSQSDHDNDRENDPLSDSSPLPSTFSFLPAVDFAFTPLSMDSDFDDTTTPGTHGSNPTTLWSQHDTEKSGKPALNVSTTVPATSSKESHPTSASNMLPPSPLGFSPKNAVHPSQRDPTFSQTSDTKEENFASNVGRGLGGSDITTGHAGHPSAGTLVEESSQSQIAQQPALVGTHPIVRTASTKSVSLRHPAPDLKPRSSSRASNIAQLEATAEKLSMTSSIDDAIRELHDEQKRADSRRSSILAASIASIPENNEPATHPLSKQISVGSSIRETNNAARHGGYSPAGYVMSPNSSMVSSATRLRSGSVGMSKPDADPSGSLSRHGPGKGSARSVRSITKPTLTNIAEIEPTALTAAAMDEADKLSEGHKEVMTSHIPPMLDTDQPQNTHPYYESSAHEYWDLPMAAAPSGHNYVHHRPSISAGSDGTFEQAERAFANFDGAHCAPEADFEETLNFDALFSSPMMESPFIPSYEPDPVLEENEAESSRPLISRPIGPPTVRPKSYLDPETGETMLYYPARVPMMLNLPQKLSKKPKAQARNVRRSQVLSAMPSANRQSGAPLLPEFDHQPLLDSAGPVASDPIPPVPAPAKESYRDSSANAKDRNLLSVESHIPGNNDGDNRMSKISMLNPKRGSQQLPGLDNLPPQLRASAYFELPSQVSTIQLKDGSATSTLDDILNASAKAPVSAFTDHAFAGSLGTEVYGTERKRKSQMKIAVETHEPRPRNSIFHLRKPSALSHHSDSQGERQDADSVGNDGDRLLSNAADGEARDHDDEDEEPTYQGPPTTLLAELQMRKQQQKLRTRPAASAFPNGMHSTLLEMDTVAEVERRARKDKKVNLAWENPDSNPADDSHDEDTPLGLLFAPKGQDTGLIGTLPGAPRPLGLMERRDMEDNEPLSVRRNRLQGREAGPIQRMTLVRGLNANPALRAPSPGARAITPKSDEIEGETLGERMRRLKAQNEDSLPEARPVSSSFSAELFSQLGDTFKTEESETKDSGKDKGKSPVQHTEEEETLGQRRRRLQAEREAREREMARMKLNGGRNSASPQLTKRHSLADILGGNGSRIVLSDPRIQAERARQAEATRYKEDQERKLAVLRNRMPSNLSTPNLERPGGFMSGRFNDGTGGGLGQPRGSTIIGGFGSNSAMPNPALNSSAMGNAFRAGGAMSPYGPAITNPYANPYGAAPQVQSAGQMASIERWRQDVS